jgi:hypothetical protein
MPLDVSRIDSVHLADYLDQNKASRDSHLQCDHLRPAIALDATSIRENAEGSPVNCEQNISCSLFRKRAAYLCSHLALRQV